jgi:hypothetical protein
MQVDSRNLIADRNDQNGIQIRIPLSTSVNGDERDDALWLIVNGAGHEGD